MPTPMQACVYEIRNCLNGKRYVGSSVHATKRWGEHKRELRTNRHHSAALQNAWNKYGGNSFVFSKLLICSKENQMMYEQRALDVLKPEYNIAQVVTASMLGRKHSPEARSKMSVARKGVRFTQEHRANIGVANKRRTYKRFKLSEEQIAKFSASLRGKKKSAEHRAKLSLARTGTKHKPETKEKIGAYSRGKPWTDERRAAQPHTYEKVTKRRLEKKVLQ